MSKTDPHAEFIDMTKLGPMKSSSMRSHHKRRVIDRDAYKKVTVLNCGIRNVLRGDQTKMRGIEAENDVPYAAHRTAA